jgi:hypothetical protein
MLSQEQANGVISWIVVAVLLASIGLWLYSKGTLRARHLIYLFLPLSLICANLVLAIWTPLLSTWSARVLLSVIGAALAMVPVHVALRIRKVDLDELDRKRRK